MAEISGFGLCLFRVSLRTLEALSMGRAVITTDAPGCRKTVINGENGYLIPTKNVQALTQAMQKFIDNPALANTMGTRSRQLAEEKYDVRKVNEAMLEGMGLRGIKRHST